MTKHSWIFAVAFVASLSMTGVASAQNSKFDGFYVGGQGHYSSVSEEVKVSGITFFDETADGFGGGGFVGFGGTNGNIYGSIEAEVGWDGAQWDVSGTVGTISGSIDVEGQLAYGLGFRAGVVIDDFLIYGRVGWIRTNFETTVTLVTPVVGSASADNDLDGGRFGGGVEGMVTDNIAIRGEYTYTIYDVDDLNIGGLSVEDDVDQHLFRVGVSYYF